MKSNTTRYGACNEIPIYLTGKNRPSFLTRVPTLLKNIRSYVFLFVHCFSFLVSCFVKRRPSRDCVSVTAAGSMYFANASTSVSREFHPSGKSLVRRNINYLSDPSSRPTSTMTTTTTTKTKLPQTIRAKEGEVSDNNNHDNWPLYPFHWFGKFSCETVMRIL